MLGLPAAFVHTLAVPEGEAIPRAHHDEGVAPHELTALDALEQHGIGLVTGQAAEDGDGGLAVCQERHRQRRPAFGAAIGQEVRFTRLAGEHLAILPGRGVSAWIAQPQLGQDVKGARQPPLAVA